MIKKIKITGLEELPVISFEKLVDFQGGFKKPIRKKQLEKIKNSIIKHGIFVPKFVWFDGDVAKIIDGHQTRQAFKSLSDDGYEIPLIPYVEIKAKNQKDAAEKLMQINSRYAEIDPDGVDTWMQELEFSPIEFEEIVELVEIPEIVCVNFNLDNDNNSQEYSCKIEAPIYEPKNKKPKINELIKKDKAEFLINKIEKSDLDEDEKEFLIQAAYRHVVFNYQLIADFYANSREEVQELMEDSALIIIDFKKAIKNGYTSLSEEIIKQYTKDYE